MIKAMILAAGEGRRMRPLTLTTPKPLLKVGEHALIEHTIHRLANSGIQEIVVNVAYLGHQIIKALGDGSRYGVKLSFSHEPEPLETGGAINEALNLLGDKPIVLINADVWSDIDLDPLIKNAKVSAAMQLVMVENPAHNPEGDYGIEQNRLIFKQTNKPSYTYAGIGLLNPIAFAEYPERREKFPLKEWIDFNIERHNVLAHIHRGYWCDVGTPERLEELNNTENK